MRRAQDVKGLRLEARVGFPQGLRLTPRKQHREKSHLNEGHVRPEVSSSAATTLHGSPPVTGSFCLTGEGTGWMGRVL